MGCESDNDAEYCVADPPPHTLIFQTPRTHQRKPEPQHLPETPLMPTCPEEMRLRDVVIGLPAELVEANHQREKLISRIHSSATKFKI